jgi:hypothetical protein
MWNARRTGRKLSLLDFLRAVRKKEGCCFCRLDCVGKQEVCHFCRLDGEKDNRKICTKIPMNFWKYLLKTCALLKF